MLLRNVLLKSLRDLRWPVFWAALGLGIMGGYFMWIFPTMSKTLDLESLLGKLPTAVRAIMGGSLIDLNSTTGFLNVELFPLMLPIILGGFAVGLASGATAGEESRGTLDILLAEPVERWRVLTEKTIAIVLATIVVAAGLFAGIEIVAVLYAVEVPVGLLAAGLVSAVLLALAFGMLALAIAAWSGNRAASIGISVAILVVTYFVNALAPIVDVLNSVRGLSPFYYYLSNNPLKNGLDVGHAVVLAVLGVVLFVVALFAFERRDLAA